MLADGQTLIPLGNKRFQPSPLAVRQITTPHSA